jgi:hypothetical protein
VTVQPLVSARCARSLSRAALHSSATTRHFGTRMPFCRIGPPEIASRRQWLAGRSRAPGQGLDARCARFAGNLRTWPAMPREKAQAAEPRCALYCRRRPPMGAAREQTSGARGQLVPRFPSFSASTGPGLLARPDARYRAAPPQQGGIKTAKLRAPGIPPGARFFGSRRHARYRAGAATDGGHQNSSAHTGEVGLGMNVIRPP